MTTSTLLLTPREAAEKLAVTPKTIRNWAHTGRIDAVRRGSRYLLPEESVQAVIQPVARSGQAEHDAGSTEGVAVELTKGDAEPSDIEDSLERERDDETRETGAFSPRAGRPLEESRQAVGGLVWDSADSTGKWDQSHWGDE